MTKVITEDRLMELLNDDFYGGDWKVVFRYLLDMKCQELDQLTVTKLRPMSEMPEEQKCLVVFNDDDDRFWEAERFGEFVYLGDDGFNLYQFKGLIPMPIYKPEQS